VCEHGAIVANLPLTLACGPYDRTDALRTGLIQPEGIDLTYVPIQSPPEIFSRMIKKDSFDCSEMSAAVHFQLRSRGDTRYVALPVFPSRLFRHGYIFVNTHAGIREPGDLNGKRVGVQEYRQTAAVWIRGMLQHEYGVDLRSIHWLEGGVNTPRAHDPEVDLQPAEGFTISHIGADRTLDQLLQSGEIDCVLGARQPNSLRSHPDDVAKLFPNSREIEQDYYRRTGLFPMMHTVAMRRDLHEAKPWVADSLYKAFVQAKDWCWQQMHFSGAARYMLPWLFDDIDELERLFGGDPWPYGLEENRRSLEALNHYLVEQGLMPQPLAIDELFTPIVLSNE
jgi:4,5-dihydroxyphthalate decarboxylase